MKGKQIVFLGGSAGMGFAAAQLALKRGASVIIVGRSQEKLNAAQKVLQGAVTTHALDIEDEEALSQFFHKIDPFDHLVSTAGISSSGGCLTIDTRVAKKSFDSKFWGQYCAAKYGAPRIRKGGSIVLFAGAFSQRPGANTAVMASINGALESLGRALAIELSPIRVNVISPGIVDTQRLSDLPQAPRLDRQLIQRLGKPEEIAETILYLLTNGYTTGTTLYPDGGYAFR